MLRAKLKIPKMEVQIASFPRTLEEAHNLLNSMLAEHSSEVAWGRISLSQTTKFKQPNGQWVDDELPVSEWKFTRQQGTLTLLRAQGPNCLLSINESLLLARDFVRGLSLEQRSKLIVIALAGTCKTRYWGSTLLSPELCVDECVVDQLRQDFGPDVKFYST